jgi:sporulation protein YlmC with PRC-barrel domain
MRDLIVIPPEVNLEIKQFYKNDNNKKNKKIIINMEDIIIVKDIIIIIMMVNTNMMNMNIIIMKGIEKIIL